MNKYKTANNHRPFRILLIEIELAPKLHQSANLLSPQNLRTAQAIKAEYKR